MGERAHEQILDGWKIGLLGESTEEGLEEGFLGDTYGGWCRLPALSLPPKTGPDPGLCKGGDAGAAASFTGSRGTLGWRQSQEGDVGTLVLGEQHSQLDSVKLTLDGRLQVALLSTAPGRMPSGFLVVATNSSTLGFCFCVQQHGLA